MRMMKPSTVGLVVGGACALAACSDLTKVTNTGIVQPSAENSAVGATAWYVGATRQFVSGAQLSIEYSAIFSDEWISADLPGNTQTSYLDTRRPQTLTYQTGSPFTTYSSALIALRFAIASLQKYAPTPGARIGQMYSYSGYLELYLAEQFCNGIPFSSIDFDGNIVHGGATSTTDTYSRAIAHFDSATAVSADSARVLNLALVGKGRALLGLGRFADAATAVANVPTAFVYTLDINSAVSGQTNILYSTNIGKNNGIPAGREGTNGINWVAAGDPRVKNALLGKGQDGLTDVYQYLGFTSTGSPIRVASGIEARLIQAEAALQANNNDASTTGNGWLGILNTLRATAVTPVMAPLADPGSYSARVDLLFLERAFWLYLTADRMPDMRRLVRQYGRTQDKVFPTGIYRDAVPYGTEVNLVPPAAEAPNPNYKGCIDRNA